MKYHVAVVASRPLKDANKRYLPVPEENVKFVVDTLDKVPSGDYGSLMHNAAANTVDDLIDSYARIGAIPSKQFPAYWFNPKFENNRDKGAGYFATEAMVRHLRDAVYEKEDVTAVLIVFYTTDRPEQDPAIKHAVEFATDHFAKKNMEFALVMHQLPVRNSTSNPATTSVPF